MNRHLICFFLCLLTSLASLAFGEKPHETKLRKDALPVWKKVVQDIEKGVVIFNAGSQGQQEGFDAIQGNCVCSLNDIDGAKERDVFAANGQYEFFLQKKPANAQAWKIRNIHVYGRTAELKNPNLENVIRSVRANTKYRPFSTYFQGFMSLVEAFDDSRFKVARTNEEELEGHACIVFEWQFTTDKPDFPEWGKVWVAPALQWSVLRMEWKANRQGEPPVDAKIEFGKFEKLRSSMVPRYLSFELSQERRVFSSYKGESQFNANPDSKVFYLSHYGFPEPKGIKLPRSGMLLWIICVLAGGGFVAIAVFLRRSAK